VRLIRSKGVSVWFITQNPTDIPDSVLGQIGNRVQHALRAYTPNDQKALNAAARSFRINPGFDTAEAIQALGVGEALVSVLDGDGVPSVAERAYILPPRSSMAAVGAAQIQNVMQTSSLREKYVLEEDRESAYEQLNDVYEKKRRAEELEKEIAAREAALKKTRTSSASSSRRSSSMLERTLTTTANTIGRELGKKIVRGFFDTFLK